MAEILIRAWRPGDLGRLIGLHGAYYCARWGLAPAFEAEVAEEMGVFSRRLDPSRDGLWVADNGAGAALGGVAIQGLDPITARLRWFIVDPAGQGGGAGGRLLRTAVDFCRSARYGRVVLHTFRGLDAAQALYRRHGFGLTAETEGSPWGPALTLQTFTLELGRD